MRRVLSIWLEGPEAIAPETKKSLIAGLLPWAYSFSPIVALDLPTREDSSSVSAEEIFGRYFFGINLDITGCSRLFSSEEKLLRKAKKDLSTLGFPVRMAIAPTLGAAWAVSRFGKSPVSILSPQGLKKILPKLSIAALRLPLKTLTALKELEISVIADLLALPRASLLSRFGNVLLKRIDQAFGQEEEPLITETFSAPLRVQKIFPGPVTSQEALMLCTKKLLLILMRRLVESEQNISVLEFTVRFVSALPFKKIIPFSLPTQNDEHIWSLLTIQCEKIDVESGIEEVSLRAVETTLVKPRETPFLPDVSLKNGGHSPFEKQSFGPLLDILKAHLQPEGIRKLQAFQSHLPEKSFDYLSFETSPGEVTETPPADVQSLLHTERPSLLFHHPSPARAIALMPDSPPFWLEWKNAAFKILHGLGPERIAPEWWGKDAELVRTRDYFKVQTTEGNWMWVFREKETGQWFVHGLWA